MARQVIDTTQGAGDTAKVGGDKINANFADLYAQVAALQSATQVYSYAISTAQSQLEGSSGSTIMTYTVTRTGNGTGASSIDFATAGYGSNPASASDFTGSAFPVGTLQFAAGDTTKQILIPIQGDAAVEPDEDYSITISNPQPTGNITAGSTTGRILNDDSATPVTVDPVVQQSGSAYTFMARRSGDVSAARNVTFTPAASSAYPPGSTAADFGGTYPSVIAAFAANAATAPFTINSPIAQPE